MSRDPDSSSLDTKPFLAHLEDLRWTIIKTVVVLALSMIACALGARQILALLYVPLYQAGHDPKEFLRTLNPTDPFSTHMEISLMGGLILALPLILYFLGQFVLPALTPREKNLLLPVFAAGAFLFLGGVAFCYFLVMRSTLVFLFEYTQWLGTDAGWTLSSYVDFCVQMLLGFGLAFEFPLVLIVLNFLGLVSSQQMASKRRHAIVIIFVLACCIVPTVDPFTLGLFCVPMYLLFELCIGLCWLLEKKRAQADR